MDENKCPQCGSKMKKDAKFCIFCGYINYDAPGNEDFRNLVVEKKVHKQIEKEKKRKEKEARKAAKRGETTFDLSVSKQDVESIPKATFRELMYRFFQKVWKLLLLIIIVVGSLITYSFIVKKQAVYVSDARSIVKEIKTTYGSNNFSKCDGSGRYYFIFGIKGELESFYNIDLKSPYNDEPYIGYVEAIKRDSGYDYFITISDGTFGIKRKNIDEISKRDVIPFFDIDYTEVGNSCR